MDSGSLWVLGFLVIGVLAVWGWVKSSGKSADRQAGGYVRFKQQVRMWLQAADREELSTLRQQLEAQRSELASRLDRLEVTLTRQGRLDNWANEVNSRLCQLELSKAPLQEKAGSQHVFAKSILCLGVRVTLMDQIWSELGIVNPQDLQDSQIHKWIQGPFCRNCLRSLVVQSAKGHGKTVRTQCRYCTLPWREDAAAPLSLVQVKREVYEYLDGAYRNSKESKE